MPWTTDGSSLRVYRNRGMTVDQHVSRGTRDVVSMRFLRHEKRGKHGGCALFARGEYGPKARKASRKYRRRLKWSRVLAAVTAALNTPLGAPVM